MLMMLLALNWSHELFIVSNQSFQFRVSSESSFWFHNVCLHPFITTLICIKATKA